VRPRFIANALNGFSVELADIGCALRVEPPPTHDSLRAALFQRSVVEVSVRPCRENLERQWRRLGEVAGQHLDFTRLEGAQQMLEALDIHRLFEAIANGLADEGVI